MNKIISTKTNFQDQGLIRRYREYLPVIDSTPVISLQEGSTPLIPARNLAEAIGLEAELFLKFEGLNPTGSFKDRGMTMAVSKAAEEGSTAVICASTGNTSASAAAYASHAKMRCIVVIPGGKIAMGKLSQALIYGAEVIAVKGNFDEALTIVRELSENYPLTLVNSVNPYRLQGQKTIAFEIVDELGEAPDYHILPVGNAGNITAHWMGYTEYQQEGKSGLRPKMVGFQAEGAAPIVRGCVVDKPETIATAIRIGNPASWKQAEAARDESGGLIDMVSDEEILEAQKLLARTEGVFCEPASAATVAGIRKYNERGYFTKGAVMVATLTGNGLKDPDTAIKAATPPIECEAKLAAVAKTLGL